ncbi:hypothetical protein Tco_1103004 [Tanacetum coccineum]
MSRSILHIPPPFGTSSSNPGSPNVNSVVDENLPQLLDSRGGSHVINVLAFDKEDFTSWKVRFLVFLDGLEPYLLKTLEDRPFVPMSSLSTYENPLPKCQNQWSNAESHLANQDKRLKTPSADVILQTPVPKDRWSREKHIKLVNIIGKPLAGITTRSRIRDSDAASASKCLYVNFFSEMEPKKLIEALKEEGWIIAMQEKLNQFERNKVWTLVPKPHGKTIIGTKWIWKNKMDENGIVIKNKARLVA